MLKTQWKVWKDTPVYHKMWADFPLFVPFSPHILGFALKKSSTFAAGRVVTP